MPHELLSQSDVIGRFVKFVTGRMPESVWMSVIYPDALSGALYDAVNRFIREPIAFRFSRYLLICGNEEGISPTHFFRESGHAGLS